MGNWFLHKSRLFRKILSLYGIGTEKKIAKHEDPNPLWPSGRPHIQTPLSVVRG